MDSCKFVHTRRTGGKFGTVCGRPEEEHCSNGFGCNEDHYRTRPSGPYKRPVHHPFHRGSKRKPNET